MQICDFAVDPLLLMVFQYGLTVSMLRLTGFPWGPRSKAILAPIFMAAMIVTSNYAAVTLAVLAAAFIYALLVLALIWRDCGHLSRAPSPRLSYFFGRSAGECLICHEPARDPVLLSCGHLYCGDCVLTLDKPKSSKCGYCGQTPEVGYNLRLERIATMQLALDITQIIDLAIKQYVGGPVGNLTSFTEMQAGSNLLVSLPLHMRENGIRYWWKGQEGYARREKRESLPKHRQWAQNVRDQMEDGWDWGSLLCAMIIAVGWSAMRFVQADDTVKRTRCEMAERG